MEALSLSLQRRSIPVNITTPEGETKVYVLREMSGAQRDQYLNFVGSRVKCDEKGNPIRMSSHDGIHAALLSRCLEDDQGKLLTKETIEAFPSTALVQLFIAAQTLNGLGVKGEEEVKND